MKLKAHKTSALAKRLLGRKGRDSAPVNSPPSETQFNRRRRMMAFIDGALKIAPAETPMFHREWFSREGWIGYDDEKAYDRAVRGFVDHRGLFLYRGSNFTGFGVLQALTPSMIDDLVTDMNLPTDTKAWLGLRPCPKELWSGESLIGTLDDLRDYLTD